MVPAGGHKRIEGSIKTLLVPKELRQTQTGMAFPSIFTWLLPAALLGIEYPLYEAQMSVFQLTNGTCLQYVTSL